MKPQRIQLRRKKGFDLQRVSMALNGLPAVNCARPGLWGNPFVIGGYHGHMKVAGREVRIIRDAKEAVLAFERCVRNGNSVLVASSGAEVSFPIEAIRRELRGKNLACFCPLYQACHADVLLAIANEEV